MSDLVGDPNPFRIEVVVDFFDDVDARTKPGENKHAGVGRLTDVHADGVGTKRGAQMLDLARAQMVPAKRARPVSWATSSASDVEWKGAIDTPSFSADCMAISAMTGGSADYSLRLPLLPLLPLSMHRDADGPQDVHSVPGCPNWSAMRATEKAAQPLNYIALAYFGRETLSERARAITLCWMCEVSEAIGVSQDVFQLAVRNLDCWFADHSCVRSNELQLVAFTALYIAAKVEGSSHTAFDTSVWWSMAARETRGMKKADVLSMEWRMLQHSEWQCGLALGWNGFNWVEYLCSRSCSCGCWGCDEDDDDARGGSGTDAHDTFSISPMCASSAPLDEAAYATASRAMLCYNFCMLFGREALRFPPSVLAACCVIFVSDPSSAPAVRSAARYSEAELAPCMAFCGQHAFELPNVCRELLSPHGTCEDDMPELELQALQLTHPCAEDAYKLFRDNEVRATRETACISPACVAAPLMPNSVPLIGTNVPTDAVRKVATRKVAPKKLKLVADDNDDD
jgi:hypothetical protein